MQVAGAARRRESAGMEKLLRSFKASAEDGTIYTVQRWVDEVDCPTRGGPHGIIDGMQRLTLEDGAPVNEIAKGVYEIVRRPPIRLTSIEET